MFPVGELKKSDVRAAAERLGLHVAEKPESQEVCFASAGEHASVVGERRRGARARRDRRPRRHRSRRHDGVANYTVGQRKGLGIGGTGDRSTSCASTPMPEPRRGRASERAAGHATWRRRRGVARLPEESVGAVVRYRMAPVDAVARFDGQTAHRRVRQPRSTESSPGQAVVCYRETGLLGGGTITCAS